MEANLEKLVRVLDWQELMCKQRSQQEELLMQSVCRLEPAYWTAGVSGRYHYRGQSGNGKWIAGCGPQPFSLTGDNIVLSCLYGKI